MPAPGPLGAQVQGGCREAGDLRTGHSWDRIRQGSLGRLRPCRLSRCCHPEDREPVGRLHDISPQSLFSRPGLTESLFSPRAMAHA